MLGFAGALFAAITYGSATILQAIGVRRLTALPPGSGWRRQLRAGYLYGIGLGMDLVGFLASLAALRDLPLFLVESMLASSVAITALLAVWLLQARLSRTEIASLCVVGLGLILLAVSAHEGSGRALTRPGAWALLIASVALLLLFAQGVLDRDRRRAAFSLAVTSGLGFGFSAIAARTIQLRHPLWHTLADPVLWAMAIAGIAGTIAYGFALERGSATGTAAITFSIETVIPAAIGLLFLGDTVRHGMWPLAALGFVAALAGCLGLAARAEPAAAPEP